MPTHKKWFHDRRTELKWWILFQLSAAGLLLAGFQVSFVQRACSGERLPDGGRRRRVRVLPLTHQAPPLTRWPLEHHFVASTHDAAFCRLFDLELFRVAPKDWGVTFRRASMVLLLPLYFPFARVLLPLLPPPLIWNMQLPQFIEMLLLRPDHL